MSKRNDSERKKQIAALRKRFVSGGKVSPAYFKIVETESVLAFLKTQGIDGAKKFRAFVVDYVENGLTYAEIKTKHNIDVNNLAHRLQNRIEPIFVADVRIDGFLAERKNGKKEIVLGSLIPVVLPYKQSAESSVDLSDADRDTIAGLMKDLLG